MSEQLHRHNATVIEVVDNGIVVQFRHGRNPARIEWIANSHWPVGTKGMVYYEITNRSGLWKFESKSE